MARQKACINCGEVRKIHDQVGRCWSCRRHWQSHGEERSVYQNKDSPAYCECGRWAEHKNVKVVIGTVVEYFNLCEKCLALEKELETDDWSPTADPRSAWHYAEYHPVFFGNKYPVRVR